MDKEMAIVCLLIPSVIFGSNILLFIAYFSILYLAEISVKAQSSTKTSETYINACLVPDW